MNNHLRPYRVPILHLSDLHFGFGFNEALWEDVNAVATKLAPKVVIVTGDLVNSPWFWSLRSARRKLCNFQQNLRRTSQDVKLIVVPGNHDSRLFGIIPVLWLRLTSLLIAVVAVGFWYFDSPLWLQWSAFASVSVLIPGVWLALSSSGQILMDFTCTTPFTFCDHG